MGLMAGQTKSQKEIDAFNDLLNNLDIKDRESPIKQNKQKVLGIKGKKGKLRKGRR